MSKDVDAYYTPKQLAKELIDRVTLSLVDSVADFSVGGGELLKTACEVWPDATYLATDISRSSIRSIERTHPDWLSYELDFLSYAGVVNSEMELSRFYNGISLILLNPPFSSRGFQRLAVQLDGKDLKASCGLAFVITALKFLRIDGQLLAILPSGTLTSEKDRQTWEHLNEHYNIRHIGTNGNSTFADCTPETVVLRFSKRAKPKITPKAKGSASATTSTRRPVLVSVLRGNLQISNVSDHPGKTLLIHSTNLKSNKILIDPHPTRVASTRSFAGPAILIPRVGKPSREKIVLYTGSNKIALSDCVFAIRCSDKQAASAAYLKIIASWDLLKASYVGTCAKYLTLHRLIAFLESLNIRQNSA